MSKKNKNKKNHIDSTYGEPDQFNDRDDEYDAEDMNIKKHRTDTDRDKINKEQYIQQKRRGKSRNKWD